MTRCDEHGVREPCPGCIADRKARDDEDAQTTTRPVDEDAADVNARGIRRVRAALGLEAS